MKQKELLFSLIKSLSKQEKRYFVLYASRHLLKGESNYIKIFDAISKQKEYDEISIKAKFSGHNFIKNFPGTKYHLYHLILKSLHSFHLNSNIDSQLNLEMDSAVILFKKGLLVNAEKIVDKAIEKAEEYQKMARLIDLLQFKLTIYNRKKFESVSEADIKQITKKQSQIIERYTRLVHYNEVLLCLTKLYYKNSVIRNKNDWKKFERYFNDPLIKKGEPRKGFYERFYYLLIIGIYHHLRGEYEQDYKNKRKLINLLNDFPYAIQDKPDNYMIILYNYCISSIEYGNIKEARYSLDQLRQFKVQIAPSSQKQNSMESLRLTFYVSAYTYMVISERNFAEGAKHIESIISENKLEDIISDPFMLNQVRYNLSGIYFYLGKLKKALDYINQVINESVEDFLRPVYRSSRLLQILILFEMGSYEVIPNLILSLRRHLKKNEELFPVEKALMDFIEKQIQTAYSPRHITSSFTSLKKYLQSLKLNISEENALKMMELDVWIESKIRNTTMIQVLSDKHI